jgi:hypothetical protein
MDKKCPANKEVGWRPQWTRFGDGLDTFGLRTSLVSLLPLKREDRPGEDKSRKNMRSKSSRR